jgi:hypothetical protein
MFWESREKDEKETKTTETVQNKAQPHFAQNCSILNSTKWMNSRNITEVSVGWVGETVFCCSQYSPGFVEGFLSR